MKSLADGLPPDIARQVHPDWYRNEQLYWKVRDQLLPQFEGQWVAFADGAVIAAGLRPVEVFTAAHLSGKHPFVICVGHEDEPSRIRRVEFPYDRGYRGEALPILDLEFRAASGVPGIVLDRVIPDTGSDASVIPWQDCQRLGLSHSAGVPSMVQGLGGQPMQTLSFTVWIWLDNLEIDCRVQVDFSGVERILGRDVLNRLDVLFRGPAGEVVVNP